MIANYLTRKRKRLHFVCFLRLFFCLVAIQKHKWYFSRKMVYVLLNDLPKDLIIKYHYLYYLRPVGKK